jgi:pre-mRNA-processing factor 19
MFCAISGTVPEQPVVSTKSGHLFEKKLVEKFVKETGRCPVTNESLSVEDLMPLKANKTVKPRPSPATSIPGLLGLFHDEWDTLMLETHTLRQSLHTVRQELSHALYMHDAATRVIARLVRERDDARSALTGVRAKLIEEQEQAAKRGGEAAEIGAPGEAGAADESAKRQKKAAIPEEVLDELQAVNTQLSKARKKRAISETLATVEELASASVLGSHPLHKTTQGGIVSMDINPDVPSILATAGLDGTVQIFNHAQVSAPCMHGACVEGMGTSRVQMRNHAQVCAPCMHAGAIYVGHGCMGADLAMRR